MENSIWRNDVKHEENDLKTMWRTAYRDMMESMRRMQRKPYGEQHMEK